MTYRYIVLFLLCITILSSSLIFGQEQHNQLAINGQQLSQEAGPYYFINYGNSRDAYAKARPLADALGLDLYFDQERHALVFSKQGNILHYALSSDPIQGLDFRPNVITMNHQVLEAPKPQAILVGEVSYVPITPIGLAFGYDVNYDSNTHTLHLIENSTATLSNLQPSHQGNIFQLSTPRFGLHKDRTRLVIDIPADISYSMAVKDNIFVLSFSATQAASFSEAVQSEQLQQVFYVQQADRLDVVVEASYGFNELGNGYAVGYLPPDEGSLARLYIDFAPHLQGPPSALLSTTEHLTVAATTQAETTSLTSSVASPATVKRVVVIDPGHGGRFAGSQGFVAEEIIVLEVALKVKSLLEASGYEVIMTRTANTHLGDSWQEDLRARTAMASTERNIFVSIHANSFANSQPQGIETYVFGQPLDEASRQAAIRENGGGAVGRIATDSNIEFANSLMGDFIAGEKLRFSSELAEAVQVQLIETTGAHDRGVKQNPYTVLRFSPIPAILVELGFVTHPVEGVRLGTDDYQNLLAEAIATGIDSFFEQHGVRVEN